MEESYDRRTSLKTFCLRFWKLKTEGAFVLIHQLANISWLLFFSFPGVKSILRILNILVLSYSKRTYFLPILWNMIRIQILTMTQGYHCLQCVSLSGLSCWNLIWKPIGWSYVSPMENLVPWHKSFHLSVSCQRFWLRVCGEKIFGKEGPLTGLIKRLCL